MSTRWRRARAVRDDARRRLLRRDQAVPTPLEATSQPDVPENLAELLDDLRALRLTLVADLTAAAAAVDADSGRVAADIVDGDRRELAAFLRRSRTRLPEPAVVTTGAGAVEPDVTPDVHAAVPGPRSWRRRALISLPAVPLVGALAMSAAAAVGLLPLPTSHAHHARVVSEPPVSTTFREFETVLDGDPSASQVVAAASALHQQIAAMLATAPDNPSGVREVAQLLQLEQALLMRKQPPGSSLVLAQSRRLAAQLLDITRTTDAAPSPAGVSTSSSSTTPPKKSSPAPKPTSSPSPTAKTSPAKTSPSSSPTPSSSPSSTDAPGHILSLGG